MNANNMASKVFSAHSNYHILNLIHRPQTSYGLFAALNHGIFKYLEKSEVGRTAKETAKDLNLNEIATTVLLDSCTSVDLLVKETPDGIMKNALYSNSEQTKRFLLPHSPESMYGSAMFQAQIGSKLIVNFEHTLKEGKSQWERTFGKTSEETFANIYKSKESLIIFQEAMESRLKMAMNSVLDPFDLSGFVHHCDIGGAGGALSYAAVKKYPKMKSTVFELPAVVNISDHFRPSAEECPNRENVKFVAGDFFKDELPPADLYSLAHILHDWDEKIIDFLLNKVYTSLPSGGGILLGELVLDDDKRGPSLSLGFSVVMLTLCTGGHERSGKEYEELLTKHGFVDIIYHQNPVPFFPGGVFARKPHYNIVNLLNRHQTSYGLFAALNHGIFEYLEKSEAGRTAEETAKDLNLNKAATTVLLDFCTSVDLLVKEIPDGIMNNALYSNSEQTKRFLLPHSPESMYGFAMYEAQTTSKVMANFEHTLKEGKSQWERTFKDFTPVNFFDNRESLIKFDEAMDSRVKMAMNSILGPFDLSSFDHRCDIGGAGGALSYAVVKKYPKMKSTVFERPVVVNISDHFRPSAEECPNRDNVKFVAGDFFKDELPPADLYTLTQILHDWDETTINFLLNKVSSSLRSGGGILLGEIILDDDKRRPRQAIGFSMYILTVCDGGLERSGKEYEELLTKHGFVDITYHQNPVPFFPGGIFARKP